MEAHRYLTRAVSKAKGYEEYPRINLEKMNEDLSNPTKRISRVTYKEYDYSGEVIHLKLKDKILEEYGVKY